MTRSRALAISLLTCFALAASPAISSESGASPAPLKTAPCRIGQTRAAGICGTLTVFENRTTRSGRTIDIAFILIEAKHRSHRAIVFNPGGPGASATAMADDFADATSGAVATLRDRYDILLVDNRGTGKSAPQNCNFAPSDHPDLYFRQLWPDSIVRACHDELAAHANLSLYSTSVASDDLDDVRAALGYPKLVLFGGSYGTKFYLDYARRHPNSVESVALEGVAPPHFYILPLPMARGAQTPIDNLQRACQHDLTCSKHFPHFSDHFAAVAQRFDSGPVTLTVQNAVTQRPQSVQLTKEVFAETIRHEMYFPPGAAYIPVTIERAYHGDYTPLAEMVNQMALLFTNLQADGLNLSVTCAEDIPFITDADVTRDSAGTFEGDARVRAQQRACKLWNVDPVPAAFVDPVRSNAPILMISGGDDPATPPEYARQALAYLPNARIMLVPGASHDSDLPPCVDTTIVGFIRAHSAAGLELNRCAAAYRRPSFAILTYDERAAGENSALTARFTKVLDGLLQGRIDRSQLTPALSRQYSNAVLKGLASDIQSLGELQAVIFKGATGRPKHRVYKYLMRFAQGNVLATFTLDASNRIAALDLSG
ncbi:MAG: alpha/beta fold hydrolase [Candidatus Eremiobacteraeota bacterium]|nr:alpha/beta fold hydrolase [Candidatus Eremiobacteraeota bacterium]